MQSNLLNDACTTFKVLSRPSSSATSPGKEVLGPRLGCLTVQKPNGKKIVLETPNLITSTSRGVVPHLTLDHVSTTEAIKWAHVPFETFLEHKSPIVSLFSGPNPLEKLIGLDHTESLLSMSLRDPLDNRDMPPNGNKYINASCVRGIRQVTPEQYLSYVNICKPDIVFALSDVPYTPAPFSQKRITKSLERSVAWLTTLLRTESSSARSSSPNVLVQMVGDTSEAARRAFSNSLTEILYGKEAEQIKPYKCLDEGVLGYTFDLIPLRKSLLASNTNPPAVDDGEQAPNRRYVDLKPLTEPRTEEVVPRISDLMRASLSSLTPDKLRLVSGTASPHEVLLLIRDVGLDLFDVAWAQKAADWGVALDFTFPAPIVSSLDGKIEKHNLGHNIYSTQYTMDFGRLSDSFLGRASTSPTESTSGESVKTNICPCIACSPKETETELVHAVADVLRIPGKERYGPPYTRAYIHHLLHTHEMSAHAFLAAHNLSIANAFFSSIRSYLKDGDKEEFDAEVTRFCEVYDGDLQVFREAKKDWISVDYARGKGRLAREKAGQGEEDLATKVEVEGS